MDYPSNSRLLPDAEIRALHAPVPGYEITSPCRCPVCIEPA